MERIVIEVSRDPAEVISLANAKRDLDVTFADDDILIQTHIDSAISYIENYTNRFLQPVVIELLAGALPAVVRLPYGPITGVTSVLVDGVAVSGFRAAGGSPYAVMAPIGQSWPFTATQLGGSVIRFTAGYPPGTVPPVILGALRAILSIFYDKPVGSELDSQWRGVERLLSPLKIRSI